MAEKIINNPSLLPDDLPSLLDIQLSGNNIIAISGHPVAGSGGGTESDFVYYPVFDNTTGNVEFHLGTTASNPQPAGGWHISGATGPQGIQGEQGIQGIQGIPGVDGKNPVFEINSSDAHWRWKYAEATSGWTDLGVVASGAVGPKGQDGTNGVTPGVRINTSTNKWEIAADGTTWVPTDVNATGPAGQNGTNGTNGKDGKDGKDGTNGKDGVSPTVSADPTTGGTIVTFTYGTGQTESITVLNGIDGASGASGASGYSPTVTTSEISPTTQHPQGGTSVTITDFVGAHQFDVWNGLNGEGATVNLLEGTGIQITEDRTNYIIGVSANYALKSELPDVSDMATKTWVSGQGYLKSVPDSYATKTYANNASANAFSQAQSWVGTQNFLKQADLAGYATETWVNQQNFATSADLATKVTVPDSADVNLKNKYLVLRTKADGTVDGWTDFNGQSYSKSEADGRYVQQTFIGNTLSGTGANANNKLGVNTEVIPTKDWMEDNYLPTSGGTVSGQLEVHGGSNFDQQFLKLTREGVTGHARLGLGQYGALALKTDDNNNHTTQINVSPNTTNDQLIQVQHNTETIGYLIPAKIHQGSYSPTSADGILHIVLES